MREFAKETFNRLRDTDSSLVIRDLRFEACVFENCSLSITLDPMLRSTVRDVILVDCVSARNQVWCARFQNVVVEGLRTHDTLLFQGAVFDQCVFRGKVGELVFSPKVYSGMAPAEVQASFDRDRKSFYESVEWALDIAEGSFRTCEIRSVPEQLVRRDPETQVAITRELALANEKWRTADLGSTHWRAAIENFLARGERDAILVAGREDPDFENLASGLRVLRELEVAF